MHGPYAVNFYSSIMTREIVQNFDIAQDAILKNYKIDKKKLVLNYRGVSKKDFPYNFKATDLSKMA